MRSEVALGDACALIVDCPHKTVRESESAYAYAVGTKAIAGGKIDFAQSRPVDEPTYTMWTERATPRPGDLIFCREAPVGPVAMVPISPLVCLGQRTVLLRPDPAQANPQFLLYALMAPETQATLHSLSEGSTVAHLNVAEIRKLQLALPSLDEQGRIASVLGCLDDKIDSNRRLVALLGEAAATVFRARFVDFVGVEEFEESEMGRIPRGWQVSGIDDVTTVTYGAPFSSALFNETEGVPLIRIRDLADADPSIRTPELRRGARLIRRGDIVVGMDGEFRAAVWHGPNAWLNQRVCCFDPHPGVSRVFLLESIKRPLKFFEATKGGTTVIHLGKRDIDMFRFVHPSEDVMASFVSETDPLFNMAVALRAEVDTLIKTRDALLPKLISGDIRVPDTHDPEEVIGPVAENLAAATP